MIVVYMPNMSRDFLQETYPDFCVFSLLNLGPCFAAISLPLSFYATILTLSHFSSSGRSLIIRSLGRLDMFMPACCLHQLGGFILYFCARSLAHSFNHHIDGFLWYPAVVSRLLAHSTIILMDLFSLLLSPDLLFHSCVVLLHSALSYHCVVVDRALLSLTSLKLNEIY